MFLDFIDDHWIWWYQPGNDNRQDPDLLLCGVRYLLSCYARCKWKRLFKCCSREKVLRFICLPNSRMFKNLYIVDCIRGNFHQIFLYLKLYDELMKTFYVFFVVVIKCISLKKYQHRPFATVFFLKHFWNSWNLKILEDLISRFDFFLIFHCDLISQMMDNAIETWHFFRTCLKGSLKMWLGVIDKSCFHNFRVSLVQVLRCKWPNNRKKNMWIEGDALLLS